MARYHLLLMKLWSAVDHFLWFRRLTLRMISSNTRQSEMNFNKSVMWFKALRPLHYSLPQIISWDHIDYTIVLHKEIWAIIYVHSYYQQCNTYNGDLVLFTIFCFLEDHGVICDRRCIFCLWKERENKDDLDGMTECYAVRRPVNTKNKNYINVHTIRQ